MTREALELPTAPAAQLAVFRCSVTLCLLLAPELHAAPANAALAPSLRLVPEGLSWFFQWIPLGARVVQWVHSLFLVAAALVLLGFYTRTAAFVMTVAAYYLLALAQTSGSVLHDMHLLWFSALLAVTPCADALSLDAWGESDKDWYGRNCDPAYGVPLWFVRGLFAAVYFFPGVWKLYASGLPWIFSDNLLHQLHWKWYQAGLVPFWRIDQHPWLVRAGAFWAVAFEVSFPFLLLGRRTRWLAAVFGVLFHLSTQFWLYIPFTSLWVNYAALLPWPERWTTASEPAVPSKLAPRWSLGVGALLLGLVLVQGVRGQVQSFPFACYPTFQELVPALLPDVRIELEHADGRRETLQQPRGRTNDRWARAWQIAGLYGTPSTPEAQAAYVRQVLSETRQTLAVTVVRVGLFVSYYDPSPEHYGEPPVHERRFGTVTPRL